MPTCVQRWIDGFVSEARRIDIGDMAIATSRKGPNSRLASQFCGGLFWPKGNNRPVTDRGLPRKNIRCAS